MAHSCKKRLTGSSDVEQFLSLPRKNFKQEQPSSSKSYLEIPNGDPEQKSGLLKVFGTNESSPKCQENAESSGKRKHSRWDATPKADEQNVDDGLVVTKRRKTRWDSDDSQLKMLGPIHLPDFVKGSTIATDDPEFQELHRRLSEINGMLQSQECLDKLSEEERFSSQPVYNGLGIMINTREARMRENLVKEKQEIIMKLVHKNPTFDPPSDSKQQKLYKKLYIPVKEYPEYNFIGLILGPRGRTQKRMEQESGARIFIRGKGSFKEGKGQRKDAKPSHSDDEDLHVLVEADSQKSLDAAVGMVEKLLVPLEDGNNKLKLSQLRELAELKNTLRTDKTHKAGKTALASEADAPCGICGDAKHRTVACPLTAPLPERTHGNNSTCETCGDADHYTIACPFSGTLLQTKTHEHNGNFPAFRGEFSPFIGPPRLGNRPFDFRPASYSVPLCSDKFNRDVDYTNLYVAHLPQHVDNGRLVQLFSPFGSLSHAQVIRDNATGLSKGYGFVKYIDSKSAAVAVKQMNGYMIDGKMLAVQVADHQHGTPGSSYPVEPTSINFPPAYLSSSAISHIPSPTYWPGPPGSMLPESPNLLCKSHGSSYATPIPSLVSSHNAASEELAWFPGNPDNFNSGYPSLFS